MKAVTVQEYLEMIGGITGFISYIATDDCWIKRWPLTNSFDWEAVLDKIIEIRIFNENEELKIYRNTVDRKFYLRHICDKKCTDKSIAYVYYDEYFDESQYINLKHEGQGSAQYSIEKDKRESGEEAMLTVRYYFGKDPRTSRAFVKDWRAVGVKGELEWL